MAFPFLPIHLRDNISWSLLNANKLSSQIMIDLTTEINDLTPFGLACIAAIIGGVLLMHQHFFQLRCCSPLEAGSAEDIEISTHLATPPTTPPSGSPKLPSFIRDSPHPSRNMVPYEGRDSQGRPVYGWVVPSSDPNRQCRLTSDKSVKRAREVYIMPSSGPLATASDSPVSSAVGNPWLESGGFRDRVRAAIEHATLSPDVIISIDNPDISLKDNVIDASLFTQNAGFSAMTNKVVNENEEDGSDNKYLYSSDDGEDEGDDEGDDEDDVLEEVLNDLY